jgi:uncharacterized protein YkwD
MSLRDILRMLFGGSRPVPPPRPPVVPPPPPPPPTVPVPDPGVDRARTVRALLDLHNKTREAYDLDPLALSPELALAAEKHAKWMADHGVMSHTGANGSSVGQRVSAEKYYWRGVGENIAAGQRTAEAVMKAWMNSPGHKSNILGSYKHVGVSFWKDAQGRIFWCVVFARPSNPNAFVVEEYEVNTPDGIWATTEE